MTALRPRWPVLLALAVLAAAFPGTPTATADHEYEQSVWFLWDTAELDVLIFGVEDPVVGDAIRTAITAWQTGIPEYAPNWLDIEIRPYFPDYDDAPPAGYEADDIEIYFAPAGFMAVQEGATDSSLGQVCYAFAPVGYLASDPIHPEELYFTAAHEFGHCLGLTHVFNHGDEYEPAFDLLGGGSVHDTYGHSCPSNLNVKVIERSFGALFSQPSGGKVIMASSSYEQSSC